MSEIVSFYNNKTVFITGATGFIGKLIVEQLLRKCEPKKLYLLLRTKRGEDPNTRLQKLLQGVIFDRLKIDKPNYSDRVEVVDGELTEEQLGISEALREKIIDDVEIVIHGAAHLNFDGHLKIATNINLKGTISLIKLCQQIKNLKSFTYISTAFVNCPSDEIKEDFHDFPFGCDNLIKLVDRLSDDEITAKTPEILGKWPNTYTFTKAAAENALKVYAANLPVAIVRPVGVSCTYIEPIPGWSDNVYGAIGGSIGVILGILRVLQIDPDAVSEVVPGDFCASAILAATYRTTLSGISERKPVYNYLTSDGNNLNWAQYGKLVKKYATSMPSRWFLLPPVIHLKKDPFMFSIYSMYYNFLPKLLVTILPYTMKNSKRIVAGYNQINKVVSATKYFAHKWNFNNNNINNLWKNLNDEDREMFNFNMDSIDWPEYIKICHIGIRKYILKESPDDIDLAIRKYKIYKFVLKYLLNTTILLLAAFLCKYYVSHL